MFQITAGSMGGPCRPNWATPSDLHSALGPEGVQGDSQPIGEDLEHYSQLIRPHPALKSTGRCMGGARGPIWAMPRDLQVTSSCLHSTSGAGSSKGDSQCTG